MLHQLLGDPLDIVHSDDQIGPIRPEAGRAEPTKGATRLTDRDHAPGGFGIQDAPTLQAPDPPDSG